ncbi:P-loop containing nucleoside triphosphate hydrolase protein, partial [Vararia minispora EC-137]
IFPYDKNANHVVERFFFGKFAFEYEGMPMLAYKGSWRLSYFFDLIFDAPDDSLGRRLASAVYKHASTLKDEMWVYQGGVWTRDKELYMAVQQADWEGVVLDDAMKESMRRDVRLFFESKAIYDALETTWKRGILLLGPPGNGKTESIKALLKESKYPALYVKSFATVFGPEAGVRSIFSHARRQAPCILVIEDLDSMLTSNVRSFFLNELDGFASNEGILTIATTNHPERIDDAIVNRPSRFDAKYFYDLPSKALRKTFAQKWIAKVQALKQGSSAEPMVVFTMPHEDIAEKVAEDCEGFSFATLKELFVSFLLALAHAHSARNVPEAPETLLFSQISALSAQIINASGE